MMDFVSAITFSDVTTSTSGDVTTTKRTFRPMRLIGFLLPIAVVAVILITEWKYDWMHFLKGAMPSVSIN